MTSTPEQPPVKTRRVFLIDDHPLVREWLANVINQQPDLNVCGQTEGRRTIPAGEPATKETIAALWQSRLNATSLGRGD